MPSPRALAVLPVILALAGCRDKGALPAGLAGSFVPQDRIFPEVRVHLNITPTGLTVTRYGLGGSGSLTVNGETLVRGTAEAGTGGAALFAALRCDRDTECRFTTKNGCEGSITGDEKGNVVLIADGECSAWSGKWMAEKEDALRASATAVTVPSPPRAPTTVPDPGTPPGGSVAPHSSFGCMSDCGHTHTTCIHECRFGDSGCFSRCGDVWSACLDRCR